MYVVSSIVLSSMVTEKSLALEAFNFIIRQLAGKCGDKCFGIYNH